MTVSQLINRARDLSPIDKIKLLEAVYDTFDNDVSADLTKKWAKEAENRI